MKRIIFFKFCLSACLAILAVNQKTFAISSCESNFVKYVSGDMQADITKNPMINMWDERFDPDAVIRQLSKNSKTNVEDYLGELSKLVFKNKVYNDNLAFLVSRLHKAKKIDHKFIKEYFTRNDFEFASFTLSANKVDIRSHLNLDPRKVSIVGKIIKEQHISKQFRAEYKSALLQSSLTIDNLQYMESIGMKLYSDKNKLTQFKKYMEFLDNTKPQKLKKGMKHINDIYDFKFKASKIAYNPIRKPHKQFLTQNARLNKFIDRRANELERIFKLHQKNGIIGEIDAAAEKEANGLLVRVQEKLRFKKKIDDLELSPALKKRARSQAVHEAAIYRKLLNGCNSGSSQRLEVASKKFSRFKFGLALGVTPTLYVYKNQDKMDTDPYFWEKLGHEMAMGLFFTFVGNKIITNTGSGFWRKYLEGYIKFGALSYAEALSYDELFGNKSFIRHFQKIYKKDVPESELRIQFEKLKSSPTFEADIKKLADYLEMMSKKNNTKNFLDKYLDLSAYSSADSKLKITREDLESEEAREMMMELLAERIYLQNMGDWPFFQTGSKGNDRFLFYRTKDVIWDVKGLMVNLAIFEIMCREPFGKVGSWVAVLSIIIGDKIYTGDLTYGYRREAINQ